MKSTAIITVLGLVALINAAEPASAQNRAPSNRAAEEAACGGDATQFCAAEIPDERRIAACLRANRAKISQACRAILR